MLSQRIRSEMMTNVLPAQLVTERSIYVAAIVLSLAMSVWSGYAEQIPNPDGTLYLRAAELFSAGEWQRGFAVYRWPFYSLGIASIIAVTKVDAILAAQILNALLDCATVVIFISLVRRLGRPDSATLLAGCAAFILVFHPRLETLRGAIVRDHGFHTFFLLSLYLAVRDYQQPSGWLKLAILASIAAAAMFRLEALLLIVLIPAFNLFVGAEASSRRVLLVVLISLLVCALAVPAYLTWMSAAARPSGYYAIPELDPLRGLDGLFAVVNDRVAKLKALLPPGRNTGIVAYVGIVAATTLDTIIRALTIPVAILTVSAFIPRLLLPNFAVRFVLWFAGWQVILLLVVMTLAFFLDWRFAVALSLIMTIPAAFAVAAIAAEWKEGILRSRLLFPTVLLAIVIAWAFNMPQQSNLEHLREAGQWLKGNAPPDAKVLTNDSRIAYFSGRAYEDGVITRGAAETTDQDIRRADLLAIDERAHLPSYVTQDIQSRLVATIVGQGGERVMIFKAR
jgi:hypothetical protein